MAQHGNPLGRASASSKRLLPWLVAVAFFMESLDTTILNTAVPVVSQALDVSPLSMKSVLASYTLSLAVFIPISGWMADRFGTRRVFASAIGLFTLGSVLCGISSNIHLLVACRVLQGCGGAMMVPVGRLTLVRAFAKSELIRAMSFVAIPGLIGPMLGPIIGASQSEQNGRSSVALPWKNEGTERLSIDASLNWAGAQHSQSPIEAGGGAVMQNIMRLEFGS